MCLILNLLDYLVVEFTRSGVLFGCICDFDSLNNTLLFSLVYYMWKSNMSDISGRKIEKVISRVDI